MQVLQRLHAEHEGEHSLSILTLTDTMNQVQAGKQEPENLAPTPSDPRDVEVQVINAPVAHDAVFGEITKDGPNYRDASIHAPQCVIQAAANMNRLDG